jgi:abortive infection bacteriophage resistance protein
MTKPVKPALSYNEQLDILEKRGCVIHDREECIDVLSRLNYYRLTAYFLPFRNSQGYYKPGVSFERIYRIYEFDRKMRQLIFSAVEEIEVHIRSHIAYHHAHKYGPVGYLDERNFNGKHNGAAYEDHIKSAISNNRNVLFVKHHQAQS